MKQVYIVLTEKCNLTCKHCIREDTNYEECIKVNDIFRIMDNLLIFKEKPTIILTGGEPTLHPDFDFILKYILEKNYKVVVTTNANTEYFNNLKENKDKKNLIFQISIDGDMKTHNYIRAEHSFQRAFKNIEKLYTLGYNVEVATTVNSYNCNSLGSLYTKLVEANVKSWRVNNMKPFGKAELDKLQPLSTQEWNSLCNVMTLNCNKIRLKMMPLFNIDDEYNNINYLKEKNYIKNCGSGNEKIYIYEDMNVYGCTCLTKFPFGNLRELKLDEILRSENSNFIKNYKVSSKSPCSDCKYTYYCNGGCIGMSLLVYDKLGMGDVRCPLIKR